MGFEVEVREVLEGDVNPLFDYEIVCRRLCDRLNVQRGHWRTFYRRVQYQIAKLEKQGQIFAIRTTNGGTVFMLKSEAKKVYLGQTEEDIPF